MTDEQFAILIGGLSEQRHLEFKGAGSISDNQLVHRVARAILAMTNQLDGGYVIVGMEERRGAFHPDGVDPSMIEGWTRDTLADKVAPLVDPSVDFDLEHRRFLGNRFVLISVREFDETPVFCRLDKHDATGRKQILREGALYVRGRRKPESIAIRTSREMRDLLDLALRKRLRAYVELGQAAGLPGLLPPARRSADLFAAQISDLGL
jgi:predicted HTH transcriptional regulator